MKYIFLIFISIFILSGCGGGSSKSPSDSNTQEQSNNSNEENQKTIYTQYSNALEYLNNFRKNAGMIELASNSLLDSAAQNHANYILLNPNDTGHDETQGNNGFTGVSPTNRAHYVNYKTGVSENIAYSSTYEKSIDSLFTAIYHRFGFLNFEIDEVGISQLSNSNKSKHASVYNMGIKNINDLCEGQSFEGSGRVYSGVCKDSTFKIEESVYLNAKNKNINANPSIIVWPYENQQDFQAVFYEENPDPLPNCSVTGNPISIQFNDNISDTINMTSFKLYDDQNNEITNTTVLDNSTDPNTKFSNKQFALFPMERLEWNSSYKASFIYTQNSISKEKTWSFKTKKLDYPLYVVESNTNPTLNLKNNTTYAIYIKPDNCNDIGSSIALSYPVSLSQSNDRIDSQTILFTLTGNIGDTLTLTLQNSSKIKLEIALEDSAK